MHLFKKIALYLLIAFFILAGINHFVIPDVYDTMMPPYFPVRSTLNLLAGSAEILCGLLLISTRYRRIGAIGIIILLILFIPVHIYMLQQAPMPFLDGMLTPAVAWIRLVVFHPLFLIWAGWFAKKETA